MAIDCRRMLPAWAPPGRLTSHRTARCNQTALLAALGVDNFGSGLFLPLTLVYLTREVGLPLNKAGPVISLGALAGLLVPAVTGRLVDWAGPRLVVIVSQLIQALGAGGFLLARSELPVLAAAMLLATGQQLFYSSLFALVSEVSEGQPPDRPFAVVNMVRAGCFGLGGLATGGLLTALGPSAYRIAVTANGASFLACAAILAWFVRVPVPTSFLAAGPGEPPAAATASSAAAAPAASAAPTGPSRRRVRPARLLSDRPFLALIILTGLVMLAVDFYLTGMPVYVLEQLHAPRWMPGTLLAVATTLSSLAGTFALRATSRLTRIAAIQAGAVLYVAWCGVSLAAVLLPPAWRPADLLLAIVLLAAAGLVCGPRAGALAASVAPPQARGRYLAAFQYAFTGAAVLAPAIAALATVAVWLPWLLVATASGVAIAGLHCLASRLPAEVLKADAMVPAGLGPAPAPEPATAPASGHVAEPAAIVDRQKTSPGAPPAGPQGEPPAGAPSHPSHHGGGPRHVPRPATVPAHHTRLGRRPAVAARARPGSVRLDGAGDRGLRRRAPAGQGHTGQH